MTLLSEDVRKQLPPLHTQDTRPGQELYAYVRLTCDSIGFTWFLLELDQEDQDTFSAYLLDPNTEQFGYFSFSYLEDHLAVVAVDVIGDIPGEGTIFSMEELPTALVYDTSFAPQSLVTAVQEERRIRKERGEGVPQTASLAEHRAYYYAATYNHPAKQVFTALQQIVSSEQVNLSVFHLPSSTYSVQPLVVVIGDRPPEPIHTRLMDILRGGTLTTIPYALLMQLFARKLRENTKGEYREHHRTVVLKPKKNRAKGKRDPRHRGGRK